MQNQNPGIECQEVDLFGQDVSAETLDTYMGDNFDGEAQASIVALLAATILEC